VEHFPSGSLPEEFFSGIMRVVAGVLHAERDKILREAVVIEIVPA